MKFLLTVHFMCGVIILSAQLAHHTQYSWFDGGKSVLDRYKETKEKSIEELAKLYEEAHTKVKALEKNGENPSDEDFGLYSKEPFKSEIKLRDVIQEEERKAKSRFTVGYFWLWGLGGLILGFACYRRIHELLGVPFMLSGFMCMIVSTHDFGYYYGVDASIVTLKLKFAMITLTLLIATAYLTGVFTKEKDQGSEKEVSQ